LEIDEVINSILRYLRERPDAGDTLEGISRWWILQERVETKAREVQKAVNVLVSRGILIEKMARGLTVYCVKREMPHPTSVSSEKG
jgi:hypothetical protein